jgi:transcriptional regulator GlxA family with amidase domain
MRRSGNAKDSANRDLKLLRRLLRARDHMDAVPHEAWPVSRLASVSGASPAHFARSFRDAFGIPPHRYLLTRRVERAVALLRDTDLPIIEIALQTGWNSIGTFGRVFRDVTGENPSELRRRMRVSPADLEQVPHCFVSAASRPHLTIAVSEKRRRTKSARHDEGKGDIS